MQWRRAAEDGAMLGVTMQKSDADKIWNGSKCGIYKTGRLDDWPPFILVTLSSCHPRIFVTSISCNTPTDPAVHCYPPIIKKKTRPGQHNYFFGGHTYSESAFALLRLPSPFVLSHFVETEMMKGDVRYRRTGCPNRRSFHLGLFEKKDRNCSVPNRQ